MMSYIRQVMRDNHYIVKGRKRIIFDWLAVHGFYRLAIFILYIYAQMGMII